MITIMHSERYAASVFCSSPEKRSVIDIVMQIQYDQKSMTLM